MTTPLNELDLPTLDTTDPEWATDAYRIVAEARDQHWLARTPNGVVVLSHADHRALITDRRLRTPGIDMLAMQGVGSGVLHDFFGGLLVSLDGEAHMRLRRLVQRAFTPKGIAWLGDTMRDVFAGLLEPAMEAGTVDMVEMVAQYPIPVICTMFGAPPEDWALFSRTAPSVLKLFNPGLVENLPEIEGALTEINEYLDGLIAAKRQAPGDDLFSQLIEIEEGDEGLDHDELVMLAAAILLGGTDTTRMHLANAVAMFCEYPDQWALLREHRDVLIPEGTPLMLSILSANRDPEVIEDPDRFDITREGVHHFTFGGGMHYCLGASLAKMELAEAISMLAARVETLEPAGAPEWPAGFSNTWTPTTLPVTLHRA
jgi:cytochrome P450